MNKKPSRSKIETTKKLLDIESRDRLTSKSINTLSNNPKLLKEYLESSLTHTFSELLFRLTHEIYKEDKASKLWDHIVTHKTNLESVRCVETALEAWELFGISRPSILFSMRLNRFYMVVVPSRPSAIEFRVKLRVL